jgi:DNA-binding NarL/FixJ family response regulator
VIRVAIADDHYLVREGTRQILEASGDVEVVAAVESAEVLLDVVDHLEPDAVVVDIRMPPTHRMEGVEAAHAIRSRHPSTGVVVLSQYADSMYAFELFRDGTAGLAYLLKDRVGDREELVRAIREVVAGGSVIDPSIVERLLARRRVVAPSPLESLTSRERDVLGLMAQGWANTGIASALVVSPSAVEKHVNAIFSKLMLDPSETETHRRVRAVLTFLRHRSQDGEATPGQG